LLLLLLGLLGIAAHGERDDGDCGGRGECPEHADHTFYLRRSSAPPRQILRSRADGIGGSSEGRKAMSKW
jgi:hypothetical protein